MHSAALKRDRAIAAVGAVVVTAALGYALIVGLAVSVPAVVEHSLALFGIAPVPAPVPSTVKPRVATRHRRQGAASPPDRKAIATAIVAPVPLVHVASPPPVIVAKVAGKGSDPSAGAARITGPGTGSGGIGDGRGSGGQGAGESDGGSETPPMWIRGRIKDSDYPRQADDAGASGTVGVRYTVAVDGRATHCRVTDSSGDAALDRTTCALIERRFRFRPSRDAEGRPVSADIVEKHSWSIEADAGR